MGPLKDAMARAKAVTIANANSHYLVCEASGACAVIEYLKGRLEIRADENLPISVITNDPYPTSVRELAAGKNLGGERDFPGENHSPERFAKLAAFLKEKPPVKTESAWTLLNQVAKAGRKKSNTAWSVVYDQREKAIQFKSANSKRLFRFDLKTISLACSGAMQMVDMDGRLTNDNSGAVRPYSESMNKRLILKDDEFSRKRLTDDYVARLSAYPNSFACEDHTPGGS